MLNKIFSKAGTNERVCAAILVLGVTLAGGGACSASGEVEELKTVAVATGALGLSCGSSEPSHVVDGGFSTTYTSARAYNDDCYKGKVVQINDYGSEFAVGGFTEVAFGDVKPSAAQCEESFVEAHLFVQEGSQWVHVVSKSDQGSMIKVRQTATNTKSRESSRPAAARELNSQAAAAVITPDDVPPIKTPPEVDPVSRTPDGASRLRESGTWQKNERSTRQSSSATRCG